MKKILYVAMIATVFCSAQGADSKIGTGGYAGLTFNSSFTKFSANDKVYGNNKINMLSRAQNLGVLSGYGIAQDSLYYGGEVLFITNNQKKTKENLLNGQVTFFGNPFLADLVVKKSNIFGVAARLGYLPTPATLIYVRFGAENSKYKIEFDNETKTSSHWSLTPGLGVERSLGQSVSARVEWTYSLKKDLKIKDLKIKTDNHRITVGLSYRF